MAMVEHLFALAGVCWAWGWFWWFLADLPRVGYREWRAGR